MKLSLRRTDTLPLYQQLAAQIREYIRSGSLPMGARLPTVRQMASEYGLTRLTVHTAYAELQAEGLIEAVVGRGTFVCSELPIPTGLLAGARVTRVQPPPEWLSQGVLADMMRLNEESEIISFAQVAPAIETYPMGDFQRAMRSALETCGAFGYGPTQGELALREQIARLLLDRGIVTAPDNVLMAAGAQQGIDLVLRACVTPEDVILVEEPTYVGLLELAVQRRQRIISIPTDQDGIQLAALEEACQRYRPRLLYLIPTFNNPTGRSLAPERRRALLRIAKEHDLLLVEDDIYGLLSYDGPALLPLKAGDDEERVIYLFSFSKVLMPALRLCAVVAAPKQVQLLVVAKRSGDLLCSPILQHALANYLRRHQLQSHIQQVRPLYRERRQAMLDALKDYLLEGEWLEPEGGLCVWVNLPEQIDERQLYLSAIQRGVGFAPGSAFYALPGMPPAMRLSFSSNAPARIRQGIAILSRVLQEQMRGGPSQRRPMEEAATLRS